MFGALRKLVLGFGLDVFLASQTGNSSCFLNWISSPNMDSEFPYTFIYFFQVSSVYFILWARTLIDADWWFFLFP